MLLDGQPVTDFAFANGILKTTAPLAWAAPSGETASVHLHLQFSAFAGYGEGASLSSLMRIVKPEGEAVLALRRRSALRRTSASAPISRRLIILACRQTLYISTLAGTVAAAHAWACPTSATNH